jgi:hypothetical protein
MEVSSANAVALCIGISEPCTLPSAATGNLHETSTPNLSQGSEENGPHGIQKRRKATSRSRCAGERRAEEMRPPAPWTETPPGGIASRRGSAANRSAVLRGPAARRRRRHLWCGLL